MFTKIATAALSTAILAAPLAVATTAHADPQPAPCVSKAERGKVHNGDKRARVARITGTDGTFLAAIPATKTHKRVRVRNYLGCDGAAVLGYYEKDQAADGGFGMIGWVLGADSNGDTPSPDRIRRIR